MRPWARNTLIAGALVLGAAGLAYYWLIVESHIPDNAEYALDIHQIRRLAGETPGDRASAIEVEEVARYKAPATAVVAGDGWNSTEIPVYSYRLVFPEGSLVIDTALSQEIAGDSVESFDAQAYERMHAAMMESSLIVITHEHMDHIGGLTAHRDLPAVLPAARLTREQLAHPERSEPARFAENALDGYEPLAYEQLHALAPGVVLIKAPGHSPGSQLVYVQTAEGSEFLFIGDAAWHFRNIEVQRERPRLVSWLMLKEDRTAVFGQLAALKRLHEAEPRIHIVPGHDGGVVSELVEAGALKLQFDVRDNSSAAAEE